MIGQTPPQEDPVFIQATSSSSISEFAWVLALLAALAVFAWVRRVRSERQELLRRDTCQVDPQDGSATPETLTSIPDSLSDEEYFDLAKTLLRQAKSVLIITGAGISADSGLPTYRGIGGLYNEAAPDGTPIQAAISGVTLHQRPALVWHHLTALERLSRVALPNAGHLAIAEYQRMNPNCWLMTQNIDGLHLRAGSPAERVLEVHGSVREASCMACDEQYAWPENISSEKGPSPCTSCGGQIRPAVVLFGEMLPENIQRTLHSKILGGSFDVVLSVGTSFAFPYIKRPLTKARGNGGFCIEVNSGRSAAEGLAHTVIRASAAEVLPLLLGSGA